MDKNDVRIVKLEQMHVASAHGFGTAPESIAWEKILAFVAEKYLTNGAGTLPLR